MNAGAHAARTPLFWQRKAFWNWFGLIIPSRAVVEQAPRLWFRSVGSSWLDRARLSGSAFSFSATEWLGINPRLVGELLLLMELRRQLRDALRGTLAAPNARGYG